MDVIDNYIGSWMDFVGHILIIKKIDDIEVRVDFYPILGSKPVNRDLLGRTALSINMKGVLQEHGLQIELGEEGLGPTLEIKLTKENNHKLLEPSVVMGLYDEYEDDFGVPWIFPLSYYKEIED
ncbi:hypothetical protein GQF01_02695 [Paenibacillus sp. 5J-6]|uniref:Uncharacterized protein n=1 Tax=Paenibacillus silvestris TaxID=2606219 RepID=A0A6L8USI4_9BACL|nr:hypothetical protein [Paenibacillus silvestris]MZQ81043.1 hypothetical protein [Paenibacillus silvestris]